MVKPRIILASASIGRKHLLEKLGVPFSVQVSQVDEDAIIHADPVEMIRARAQAKAEDIVQQITTSKPFTLNPNPFLIIAADSMAILNGKTYGKASDKTHAKQIVTALMGQTHDFVTATSIIHYHIPSLFQREGQGELLPPQKWHDLTHTSVTMKQLTPVELEAYTSRYDFTRFAAGYTLNETPWDIITKIDGSYTNVIGLPFEVILPIFHELQLI
jgi:septum formation protein